MKVKIQGFAVATMVLAGLLGTGTPAHATFVSYICDDVLCTGGGDVIVTDQGAGDNFPGSAVVGQINAGAINVGAFAIVTNIAQSKPLIGSALLPQMDLTFSAVTIDNAAHTIWLYASDQGFLDPHAFLLTMGGTQPPPGAGDSVTGRAWGGNSNNLLDLSSLLASVGPTTATPFALSANASLAPTSNPYSLTIGVAITRNTAGTTTGDLNLSPTVVPEPGSMTLLGAGLLGLVRKLRRRQTTV